MTGWGFVSERDHATGSSSNTGLFLALYLLLLAFFILLNSISRIEEVKSKAVIDSVTTTFAGGVQRYEMPPVAGIGDILALEEAQREIGEVMRTLVPAARVEVKVPGHLMEVVLPASAFFAPGETAVKSDIVPFLDRLIAALSTLPGGFVAELQVLMSVAVPRAEPLPVRQTVESARLGALLRALLARGMPETMLTAGLVRGKGEDVTMIVQVTAEPVGPSGSDSVPGATPATDGGG